MFLCFPNQNLVLLRALFRCYIWLVDAMQTLQREQYVCEVRHSYNLPGNEKSESNSTD